MNCFVVLLLCISVKAEGLLNTVQEQIQTQTQDAIIKVLAQDSGQSDYADYYVGPPSFKISENFMHAFRPNTGVGNREDLILDRIRQVDLFEDSSFSRWQHMRFNNSDYVLGIGPTYAVLWQKNLNPFEPFDFAVSDGIFKYTQGAVSDAVMFTHTINKDAFYVAILTENERSSFISIYEIIDGRGMMITVIDLGRNPAVGSNKGRKLAYVQSRYGGALAVLFPSESDVKIKYRMKGSNILNHYIEVHYPSAVRMVAFKIGEHGYLAVANKTICEVYKMGDFMRNHLLFERLYFDGEVAGLESFRLGFHRYLAVLLTDWQFLYVWKPGGFFGVQQFHSNGVRQIFSAVLPNCRDDIILIFFKDYSTHEFYVWSGRYEQFVPAAVDVPANMLPWPGTSMSFSYGSSIYLQFIDHYGKSVLFTIDTHLSPIEDPVLLLGKEVSDLVEQLQASIDAQAEKVKLMSDALAYAVRPSGTQQFTNMQVFSNLFVDNEILAGSFHPSTIVWEGSNLSLAEYLRGTDDLAAQLTGLEQQLDELDSILPGIVRSDENTLITGRKVFSGVIYAPSISAQSVHIHSVRGIDIPALQKQIYRLDKPITTIMGTLKFDKPVSVIGDIDATSGINGIDFSKDVLTTNSEQISQARMAFNKVVVHGDLTILNKMNNIKIGSEVVTLYHNNMVFGKKTFKGGIVSGDVVADYIDGIDIQQFYSQAMTKTGDQTFTAAKHFTSSFRTQNITINGKINLYDVNDLAKDIVRIDVPAAMHGKTFLQDLHIKGELQIYGKLNGLKIPDDLFIRTRSNIFTGKKNFYNVYVDDINAAGTIDGLNLPLDVITLSADEAIQNTLYFTDGISVENDVFVYGTIDGKDVSELAKEVLKSDDTQHIDTAEFSGSLEILSDLNIAGNVNGIPLYDIANDVVYEGDSNIVIKSKKHFVKLTANSIQAKKLINNYNIKKDFMTTQGDQTIYDMKKFYAPVTFQSITTADDMVSGVNLTQLYLNRITLSVENELSEDLEFGDHVVINGGLVMYGTLDGYKFPEDFVIGSTDQEISNKMFQGTTYVNSLTVYGNVNAGSFGGLQLQDFVHERVTLTSDQVLEGDIYLVNATAMSVDVFGKVNELDIVDFANNVMSLTRDQTVSSFKEFLGTTSVWQSMTTSNGINSINLAEVNRRAVKLNYDNVITSPVAFANRLSFNSFSVFGLINGVNLTQLDLDSMKTEEIQYMTGPCTFHKGFHVEGDIISSNINGIDVSREIMTKTTPQTIKGTYIFNNLSVLGNLEVHGLVNGVDLSELALNLAKIGHHNVIYSDLVFKNFVQVTGDLDVIGLVNGLDLKHLEGTAITKSGEQHVTAHKVLRGNITVYGDVNVFYVNGVSWSDFMEDIVRVDIPQTIAGVKLWDGDLKVTGNIYVRGFADIDVVNGIKLSEFLEQAVFLNQPAQIKGTKIFTSPIRISSDVNAEFINNLRLKVDVITVQCGDSEPQIITGQKTFQNLTVFGDVSVNGYVNGYKLADIVGNTLMVNGDQIITGHKTFQRPVAFLKNLSPLSINELVVNRDLVTLDTAQNLFGNMVFFDAVNVDSNLEIHGRLNGIDLKKLSKETLYTNTNEMVLGEIVIDHAVVQKPVFVEANINDISLDSFSKEVNDFWNERHGDIVSLGNMTQYHCELAQYLHSSFESSYSILSSFKLHQVLNLSVDHIEVFDDYPYLQLMQVQNFIQSRRMYYQWHSDKKFYFASEGETSGSSYKRLSFEGREITIHIGVKSRGSVIKIDNTSLSDIERGFIDGDFSAYSGVVFVALIYSDNVAICKLYMITSEDVLKNKAQYVSSLTVKGAKSLAMFNSDQVIHLAVSCDNSDGDSYELSKIYAWLNDGWKFIQDIQATASRHVIHFIYYTYHYLVFTNVVSDNREQNSILVYRNTAGKSKLNFFQKIPFDNAKKLAVFEFGGSQDLYLTTFNSTVIQIFLLKGEAGFQSHLSLHGSCISDARTLLLYGDLYLVVGHQSGSVERHSVVIYRGSTKGSSVAAKHLACS